MLSNFKLDYISRVCVVVEESSHLIKTLYLTEEKIKEGSSRAFPPLNSVSVHILYPPSFLVYSISD